MKYFSLVVSVFILVLLNACGDSSQNSDTRNITVPSVSSFIKDSVFLKSSNNIRNFPAGTRLDEILKNERLTQVEKENDFLLYTNSDSLFPASFSVAYTFASNLLEETEIRIETDEDSLADRLMPEILQYLKANYGEADSDQGIQVFRVPGDSSRFISVCDNSSEGHTSLSILYYQEK